MSFLLPQTRPGIVRAATSVDIHGDRYVDVSLALEDDGTAAVGRVGASECPADLRPGDHVQARFVMGVMVKLTRD